MQTEIQVRLYDVGHPLVAEAYSALFAGDPDKSADLLAWRFRSNPHGQARFVIASRGSTVVGMIALIPTRLCNLAGTRLGYQAIDTSVHPSCRGQGLFVKMGSFAQDCVSLGGDILWGFPNANAAPGWYGHLGWTNFGPVPLLVRPLRSSFLFDRVHRKLRWINVPLIRGREISCDLYRDPAQLSSDFGKLWQRVRPQFGIGVDRVGEWMSWRLFEKPDSEYRCVGLKSEVGALEAFVAVKVADKHGARLCYVMEAISTSDRVDYLGQLLHAELALAERSGAEAALAWCPKSAPNYQAYRKAGFLPVPPKVRPIEINFGARALSAGCAAAAAPTPGWYVSFLDSDTN